ncbi:MAG: hypothetical protein ACTHOH_12265 [Lysobacteraceae bacterium]
MKCFRHQDLDAVGICRGCGKGVCAAHCVQDLGTGLACSDACRSRVEGIEALNRKTAASYGTMARNVWIAPLFFGAMGGVFLFTGLRDWPDPLNFVSVLGGLFLLFALVTFLRNRRLAAQLK